MFGVRLWIEIDARSVDVNAVMYFALLIFSGVYARAILFGVSLFI